MHKFTLTIESENNPTILNRICQVFSEKRIEIEELSMISSFDNKYITLTTGRTRKDIEHIIGALEKEIGITNITCKDLFHPTV